MVHIISGSFPCLLQISLIRQEFVHQPFKIIITGYFKTAFLLQQMLRLAEFLVVRSEYHRNTIYSRFQHIMNSNSKATPNIRNLTISVNGGQQSVTVDNQTIGLCHIFFRSLGIADARTFSPYLKSPSNDCRSPHEEQ